MGHDMDYDLSDPTAMKLTQLSLNHFYNGMFGASYIKHTTSGIIIRLFLMIFSVFLLYFHIRFTKQFIM